ncbi:lipoteichoic acid synthase 2 [Ruminiclostridium hungatei]|uniref:Lipoteichoic acid synthase 2 n=2 Tax=Ruminiclostridium hungatei TaxID=48256 RepID=A0A1V4SG22_RUMHU|nr:alkaline phosphatase family protein [Ruminiclostridium hungatei]OPX42683.1 lipoteichoic acid synthase 2 [Ruminiclostridium hungatei]
MDINQITTDLKKKRERFLGKARSLMKGTRPQKAGGGLEALFHKCADFLPELKQGIKSTALVFYLYRFFLFYPLAIIYMEVVFKLSVFKSLLNVGLFYMVLYSIPAGLLLYILSTFTKRRVNRIISIILTAAATLVYLVQVVYYQVFTTFFALFSINGTGQVLQFWREILSAIGQNIIPILFLLVPLLFIIIFGNKFCPSDKTAWSFKGIMACLAVTVQIIATLLVVNADKGELSTSFLYQDAIIPDLSVERFGLMTTTRLDVKHLFFGFDAPDGLPEENSNAADENSEASAGGQPAVSTAPASNTVRQGQESQTGQPSPESSVAAEQQEQEPGLNIMNIDFDKLINEEKDPEIQAMHKYFKSVEPTNKNEYTGRYKGKNLILITAEGFSPYAVNKELTPTLYRMSQEGFQFTNFYTPIWGVSTSDGEYVACNSLVPKSGVWSFYVSGRNYMPFCLGNQLKKLDYATHAYHDHSYTYYHRDVSHPNMGYDFKAVGHGLDVKKTWPESDVEMIEKTTGEYIDSVPFHTYYMTVSGHLQYNFGGNAMASKNKELVKDLAYSNHVKAYLACQIELDRAIGELISRLESAGVAEDTLIAISPDHYPYGLTVEEIGELAGHKIEENFELYKGIFLLWSKGMTPVKIDKPCASMDILPTLSNLMGIEYDSRLLMGRDIMSDAPPLVVFSNWSWLTDKARYNSKARKLILAEGQNESVVTKEYRTDIARQVNNKFTYSTKILDKNYYAKVFKN